MADEAIDGYNERADKIKNEVLHGVTQGRVTAERFVFGRDDRARGGSHELLRVRAHKAVIRIFDNLPAGTKTEREHDQKKTEEPFVEIDIFVVLRHDDMDKPESNHREQKTALGMQQFVPPRDASVEVEPVAHNKRGETENNDEDRQQPRHFDTETATEQARQVHNQQHCDILQSTENDFVPCSSCHDEPCHVCHRHPRNQPCGNPV